MAGYIKSGLKKIKFEGEEEEKTVTESKEEVPEKPKAAKKPAGPPKKADKMALHLSKCHYVTLSFNISAVYIALGLLISVLNWSNLDTFVEPIKNPVDLIAAPAALLPLRG